MKNSSGIFLGLLLLTFSSCSSIYRFTAEVQEPAPVTLPLSAQNVLILNNLVSQPYKYGVERTYDGKVIQTEYPLPLDSVVWPVIDEIASMLKESDFFNEIAVYQKPVRTDTEWLVRTNLSSEVQSGFYNTENYDALLTIDQLLFVLKEDIKRTKLGISSSEQTVFADIRLDALAACSMYSYGNEKPLITFSISDSLFVKSVFYEDSVLLFKEIPESLLNEIAHRLGNQIANRFIPTWKTVERILFSSHDSRMQEALGYAKAGRWTDAESIGLSELNKKTKISDQARIAFNLAVINEMQDKLETALVWAQKAKEYFTKDNPAGYPQETMLTTQYISELQERIQNNRLLDLQWGKEK